METAIVFSAKYGTFPQNLTIQLSNNLTLSTFLITLHRRYSRSEKLKYIWFFPHLLDKIFTLEQTNSFVCFSLNQIFRTFVSGM